MTWWAKYLSLVRPSLAILLAPNALAAQYLLQVRILTLCASSTMHHYEKHVQSSLCSKFSWENWRDMVLLVWIFECQPMDSVPDNGPKALSSNNKQWLSWFVSCSQVRLMWSVSAKHNKAPTLWGPFLGQKWHVTKHTHYQQELSQQEEKKKSHPGISLCVSCACSCVSSTASSECLQNDNTQIVQD